jgi:purine-binding chemotaxis protein CheW
MSNLRDKELEDYYLDDDYEDTLKDKFLTFTVGKQDYGVEIRRVTEIVVIQKITEVPDVPSYVRGVINLRGYVLPVIDIRTRFNMEIRNYDERTCVVVVNYSVNNEERRVGLVVDRVKEVVVITEDRIAQPMKINNDTSSRIIQGMGRVDEEVKILLNIDHLLQDERIDLGKIMEQEKSLTTKE